MQYNPDKVLNVEIFKFIAIKNGIPLDDMLIAEDHHMAKGFDPMPRLPTKSRDNLTFPNLLHNA